MMAFHSYFILFNAHILHHFLFKDNVTHSFIIPTSTTTSNSFLISSSSSSKSIFLQKEQYRIFPTRDEPSKRRRISRYTSPYPSEKKSTLSSHRNNANANSNSKEQYLGDWSPQSFWVSKNQGRTLTPFQILDPFYFPYQSHNNYHDDNPYETNHDNTDPDSSHTLPTNTDTSTSSSKSNHQHSYTPKKNLDDTTSTSIPLPFKRAVDKIIEALSTLADTEKDIAQSLNRNLNTNGNQNPTNLLSSFERYLSIIEKHYNSLEIRLGGSIWSDGNIIEPISNDDNYYNSDNHEIKYCTIRIEQEISHTIDPLCWLHANSLSTGQINILQQQHQQQRSSNKHDYFEISPPPMVYFSNSESTSEIAAYGSSWTIQSLDDNDNYNENTSDNNSTMPNQSNSSTITSNQDGHRNIWNDLRYLPPNSRVIGGSRFDNKVPVDDGGSSNIEADWKEFGQAIWILPTIEVRQETIRKYDKDDNDHDKTVDNNNQREFQSGYDNCYSLPDDKERLSNDKYFIKNHHNEAMTKTTLSVHLRFSSAHDLIESAHHALKLLKQMNHLPSPPVPTTTLPPIISRGYNTDAQEVFENGVQAALDLFTLSSSSSEEIDSGASLQKVVLARRADLHFDSDVSGLDVMMKLKFGGHVGGHLFYLNPGGEGAGKEFLGCTPERLFSVQSHNRKVFSEALAGTRPRGSTSEEDAELLNDLMTSEKDRSENVITGRFIQSTFDELYNQGMLESPSSGAGAEAIDSCSLFVRRLRHLQHLCQSYEGKMKTSRMTLDVAKSMLNKLHPTPALCGFPFPDAMKFIREYETKSFDRGLYSGPFGYLGNDSVEIVVAIRSALVNRKTLNRNYNENSSSTLSVYAGAGIVPGSTVQGEWSETSYKLGVLSSLFSQSPITLQSSQTPNVAWSTAFVEELIRNGVTQYYICPGSRSTPLTAALSRAQRINVGVINCISVHDERSAGFRALGYARSTNRPAAIVTSSGTAVANLYPSVVEASMDSVPLLVLTADRPYENRDIGANQSIDQIKIFSDSYIRWFRDISPPSDDVPVSLSLSDANHAVSVARNSMGPVHLNIQFRENLAPDLGQIRGDNRIGSVLSYSSSRFTDVPGFQRWSLSGSKWTKFYPSQFHPFWSPDDKAALELATLIMQSKRGLIVVGNIKSSLSDESVINHSSVSAFITDFAQSIGFPILAGVQSANLRFSSSAVIPYAEFILKNQQVKYNLKPDLIIQIGTTLVSTEIQSMISHSVKNDLSCSHVLIHPHRPSERTDPGLTNTHVISSDALPLLDRVMTIMKNHDIQGSDLTPLILLGRNLGNHMSAIINDSSNIASSMSENQQHRILTEPQIILALSEVFADSNALTNSNSLFLSNSMPVRDAEFFLYPPPNKPFDTHVIRNERKGIRSVAMNRGASGIDGIISTATGYSESLGVPTTLLIGDLSSIHDINAFHNLAQRPNTSSNRPQLKNSKSVPPLTTIVVNNDGCGIFSFLPIAKHGNDVGFEDFFGTPTSSFSFSKAAESFGLPYKKVDNYDDFKRTYVSFLSRNEPMLLEAQVVGREKNVKVHAEISKAVDKNINEYLEKVPGMSRFVDISRLEARLPAKIYGKSDLDLINSSTREYSKSKTLILLHGWMGDKQEWENIALSLIQDLDEDWNIIAIDLPGHGDAPILVSADKQLAHSAIFSDGSVSDLSRTVDDSNRYTLIPDNMIESFASSVLKSLHEEYGVTHIDALCGYSLGGRIALAMKKMCSSRWDDDHRKISSNYSKLFSDNSKLILLSSYPGNFDLDPSSLSKEMIQREHQDKRLATMINNAYRKKFLFPVSQPNNSLRWKSFLSTWYGASHLWGSLEMRKPEVYKAMVKTRTESLSNRGPDLAFMLQSCSPGKNSVTDWTYINPDQTYFLAGDLDKKYSDLGKKWKSLSGKIHFMEIKNSGHALPVESPRDIADILRNILENKASNALFNSTSTSQESRSLKDLTLVMKLENIRSVSSYTEVVPKYLDFESFTIELIDNTSKKKGLSGIGWGEKAKLSNHVNERRGFIINLSSEDGRFVGIGEVSPLNGLHPESLEAAIVQLQKLKSAMNRSSKIQPMLCEMLLSLDGSMNKYLNKFLNDLVGYYPSDLIELLPSVKSGLEMALLSLASQATRIPLPQALISNSPLPESSSDFLIPLNGLMSRGSDSKLLQRIDESKAFDSGIRYPSTKIKVGHREQNEDLNIVKQIINVQKKSLLEQGSKNAKKFIRMDANRSWDIASAIKFSTALSETDVDFIEFIEEPLQRKANDEGRSGLMQQLEALEQFYQRGSLKYALDESLADFLLSHTDIDSAIVELREMMSPLKGCAAIVLKPSLLGIELSMRLAKLARDDLSIGAVFSSSFDSGIGLAFTAFLAATSDTTNIKKDNNFPHGISTFSLLNGDTLSPTFGTYVNADGMLNVLALGRAIYGLGLDEMRPSFSDADEAADWNVSSSLSNDNYQTTSSTSVTGREVRIQVSLPLPFSDNIGLSRFADLPQQPRWSPWLNSVAYIDTKGETEWTLNVRGFEFRWTAKSKMMDNPKGIMWESTSGLKNKGAVEFVKITDDSCLMKLEMSLIVPRVVAMIFKTTGEFVKDFLENKVLKWSLESFRDVVKADLALERGDVELGDALFGAVEGRANAIEATLNGT